MQKTSSVKQITIAALLTAVGIVIPLISPFRLVLEPASFTLASHVPIFLAMFISPGTAAAVAAGSALGFFLTYPPVVGLRAASHIIFVLVGAFLLKKYPSILTKPATLLPFALFISILHAVCELGVVTAFYTLGTASPAYYENGYFYSVFVLVGVGTVIHSMVDFFIALFIAKALGRQKAIQNLFMVRF